MSCSYKWYFPIKSENECFENWRRTSSGVEGFSHRAWHFFMSLTLTRPGSHSDFSQSNKETDESLFLMCLFSQNIQKTCSILCFCHEGPDSIYDQKTCTLCWSFYLRSVFSSCAAAAESLQYLQSNRFIPQTFNSCPSPDLK